MITVCPCWASNQLRKSRIAIIRFYGPVQLYVCYVGAEHYTMFIQTEQHFSFSGIAGFVPINIKLELVSEEPKVSYLRQNSWYFGRDEENHIIIVVFSANFRPRTSLK